jgi:hypothetical protein
MKFFIVLLTFFFGVRANACDCDSIKGAKDADAVFKGKVLKVQRMEEPYIRYEITFQITKWIKGKSKKRNIVIDTPCLLEACCGIAFQTGEVYQVYAFEDENRLETTQCWATRKIK